MVEMTSRPAIIGMVIRPDWVALAPRASCMYWARNTEVPNIDTPTEIEAMTERVKVRFLNIVSGMIGSAALNSTMTNAIRAATAPPTIQAEVAEAQSKFLPAMETQISSSETPAESSTMPA